MCVLVARTKVLEHLVLIVIFDRSSISLFEGVIFRGPDSWLFFSDVLAGCYLRLNLFVCSERKRCEYSNWPLGWKAERLGSRVRFVLRIPPEVVHPLWRKGRLGDVQ